MAQTQRSKRKQLVSKPRGGVGKVGLTRQTIFSKKLTALFVLLFAAAGVLIVYQSFAAGIYTCEVTVSPVGGSIVKGGSASFFVASNMPTVTKWHVAPDNVDLLPGFGTGGIQGYRVTPTVTTTYTLTATGTSNSIKGSAVATCTATVTVTDPVVTPPSTDPLPPATNPPPPAISPEPEPSIQPQSSSDSASGLKSNSTTPSNASESSSQPTTIDQTDSALYPSDKPKPTSSPGSSSGDTTSLVTWLSVGALAIGLAGVAWFGLIRSKK